MFQLFEVGGAVRDKFLGVDSKDVDFVVVMNDHNVDASTAFSQMQSQLESQGFQVFLSNPEFFTLRAQVPKDSPLKNRTNVADFVMARKDGPSSNGRHPDWVLPGTLLDDLSRRDFTVNAMALDMNGDLQDPFDGMSDLKENKLRFVGDAQQRVKEDGLRVLRALRFSLTKNLTLSTDVTDLFDVLDFDDALRSVSTDRLRDELSKMFNHSTMGTLNLLNQFPDLTSAMFSRPDLKLQPTMKSTVR